jgi:hypothetical protein
MPTGACPAGTAAQPCTTAETRLPNASGIAKPMLPAGRPVMVCGFGHRVCPRKPGCVPMPLRTVARPCAKAQQSRGFYLTNVMCLTNYAAPALMSYVDRVGCARPCSCVDRCKRARLPMFICYQAAPVLMCYDCRVGWPFGSMSFGAGVSRPNR